MENEVVYDLQDPRWVKNTTQIGDIENNKVVLTFDDGPSRQLNSILDILKNEKVSATFFWQSRLLHHKRPWKRVLDEGHTIGSHATNHKNLAKLTADDQYKQISYSKKKIETITGDTVRYFRPPFGSYNESTLDVLKHLKLIPIMWEISSYDWELKEQPYLIVSNVVENVKPGSIILLHELPQTVAALPYIIKGIREKGFNFCNL